MTYGEETEPLAIAHRGGAHLAPENTLAAFSMSTALGLRYLESDIRLTADGELVCFHDEVLDRCTTGTGRIGARTLADLRRTVRVGGTEPIPTLEEALTTFPDACFTVDLKNRAAIAPMARLLQRRDFAERVCVAGAWDGWLQLLASQAPHLRTALGWRSLVALISASKAGVQPPSSVVRGRFAHVPVRLGRLPIHSPSLVRRAHRLGVRVVVWTVDEPGLMHELLDMGVDGIITDRPDVLRTVMISRGTWTPMRGDTQNPGIPADLATSGSVS
ncbi:glycerophosphodiester phosphodiesterase family protein [Janibacter terrae]|uniref:Glycerophosphodiester phosphodiesterase family protein n=1 Tax=Janibacter terrae TaxID=103817 RepID=A0ABZ2FCS3_9MICO|nr:glycerophosphodiester phosphodiesterase [Janibacter terrae]